jgi:hypothetical protein
MVRNFIIALKKDRCQEQQAVAILNCPVQRLEVGRFPNIKDKRSHTTNMKNRTFATREAAVPTNPKIAAIAAMMRKTIIQRSNISKI